MTELEPEKIRASRTRFVVLLLIAFVPIFIAYASFFYFPDWAPDGTTNNGQLIVPPQDATLLNPELANYHAWVLIQPVDGPCEDACRELMYLSRQVITALGKDADRVKRVLLASGPVSQATRVHLGEEHPDMQLLSGESAFRGESTEPYLLLMDPNANVMMRFGLDQAGKPMLRDLKHLLKISNIG